MNEEEEFRKEIGNAILDTLKKPYRRELQDWIRSTLQVDIIMCHCKLCTIIKEAVKR